jgi:hypothetical protein
MKNPFENLFKNKSVEDEEIAGSPENKVEYNDLPEAVKQRFEEISAKYRSHTDLGVFGIESIRVTPLENATVEYQINGRISMKLVEKDEYGKDRFSTREETFKITAHDGTVD